MAASETRTALVTGATSGIGRACALYLSEHGWRVFAGVRDEDAAARLRADAERRAQPLRSDLTTIPLDITSDESVAAAVEQVHAITSGQLYALVNNAGIPSGGPVEALPMEAIRGVIESNLTGQFAVTRAFLPLIRAVRGRIVFIGSIAGRMAFPFAAPYHASKFGLEGFAESLRAEMEPLEVEVTVIEPGSMDTEIWRKAREQLQDVRASMTEEQRAVYGEALDEFDAGLRSADAASADPVWVAEKLTEALTSESPEPRYAMGQDAGALNLLRPLLPDAIYERVARGVSALDPTS